VLAPEDSGSILTQDVPIRVEMITTNVPLGADDVHADKAEPFLGDAIGDDASPLCLRGEGDVLGFVGMQP
jgi:hypothetical protein